MKSVFISKVNDRRITADYFHKSFADHSTLETEVAKKKCPTGLVNTII